MKNGLAFIWSATLLPHNNSAGYVWEISKSWSKLINQVILQAVEAKTLYSALAADLETVDYFFDLHEIRIVQKHTKASNKFPCVWTSCPVRICKCLQMQ